MKYLFLANIFLVIVFSINKYAFTANNFHNAKDISDVYHDYPVNLIDLKLTVSKYIVHLCEENEPVLSRYKSDVDECINAHNRSKRECLGKIFRLAPMNIDTAQEVARYGQEYKLCTLPYKNFIG